MSHSDSQRDLDFNMEDSPNDSNQTSNNDRDEQKQRSLPYIEITEVKISDEGIMMRRINTNSLTPMFSIFNSILRSRSNEDTSDSALPESTSTRSTESTPTDPMLTRTMEFSTRSTLLPELFRFLNMPSGLTYSSRSL